MPTLPTIRSLTGERTATEDAYLGWVSQGNGRKIAQTLGLPTPVSLRRHNPERPFIQGPVVLFSPMQQPAAPGEITSDADRLAHHLLDRGLEIHRHADELNTVGAVVVCLTQITDLSELTQPALELGAVLRRLAPGGRVVVISRSAPAVALGAACGGFNVSPPHDYNAVGLHATRQAVVGFVRSVAQEMRAGATANGIVVADGVDVCAPSVLGSLDFLLSGRSAFISGQFFGVATDAGPSSLVTAAQGEQPLKDKVVVVTGAARGIGEKIAQVLHHQGAQVVPVDVPASGQALSTLASQLGTAALSLDVTADDAGLKILEHCRARYGRMNAIVHNAGITRDKLLANMDHTQFNSVLAVNAQAPLRITEQLVADPISTGLKVVAVASTSGIAGNRGQTNYAASKAAIIGMVATLAPLIAEHGGSANAVAPGFIETEMTAKIPVARRQLARRLNSLQQGGLPVDVAELVAFLVSDAACGINGQTVRVCGQNMVGA